MTIRSYQSPLPGGDAQSKVNAPATALIVIGWISIAVCLLAAIASCVCAVVLVASGRESDVIGGVLLGAGTIVLGGICMIWTGMVIFGAMKMKNLQSYGLAMTAAILSICSLACLPTAFGIWALVVLLKPEVKAAFKARSKGTVS